MQGLTPGETVVTDGQLRLEQGTRVQLADANGLAPAGGGRGRGRGAGNGNGNSSGSSEGQGRRGGRRGAGTESQS